MHEWYRMPSNLDILIAESTSMLTICMLLVSYWTLELVIYVILLVKESLLLNV